MRLHSSWSVTTSSTDLTPVFWVLVSNLSLSLLVPKLYPTLLQSSSTQVTSRSKAQPPIIYWTSLSLFKKASSNPMIQNSNSNNHTHIPRIYPYPGSTWANSQFQLSEPLLPRWFCLDVTNTYAYMSSCCPRWPGQLLIFIDHNCKGYWYGRRLRWHFCAHLFSCQHSLTHSFPLLHNFGLKKLVDNHLVNGHLTPQIANNCANANANNSSSSPITHPLVINIGSLEGSVRAADLFASSSTASTSTT